MSTSGVAGRLFGLVLAVGCSAALTPAAEGEITLVKEGVSDYVVVVAGEASPSEQWAAEDFVAHVRQMSGAVLQTRAAAETVPENAVVIGDGPAARALGVAIDTPKLGPDGYVIKTVGRRLVIAGGRERGTMYGVYAVLEKLGCRWWAPGAAAVPQLKTITLAPLDETRVPVLEYRAILYGDSSEPESDLWCARNRINGLWFRTAIDKKYGGSFAFDSLAHTFSKVVPPEKHFADHPEYYALRGAARTKDQLCLSNPEVVRIAAESLLQIIKENPDYHHVTVGQDDNNNYCQCDGCKALYDKYGAPSGAMVAFANQVAEIVGKQFPDMMVNTMAYRWSRKPPVGIKPADNVMITLCSIECNFAHPLAEGFPEENAAFVRDAEEWARLARKIYVWDYTTNFVHYLLPFPNYYSLTPNVKFFVDHKVRGLFEQGSHTTRNGQFARLCMWVEAQAMWNPEADGRKLVEEFMMGYYGPAAGPLILEYANLLHDKCAKDRIPAWATHRSFLSDPYMTFEIMARAEQLFEQAEAAVKDDPELLRRVQVAHLPVQYVLLCRPGAHWEATRKLCPGLTWTKVAEQFARVARENGVTRLAEGGGGAETFYAWALDYAKLKDSGKSDLPPDLQAADPATWRFYQPAQFDKGFAGIKKVEGADDGWAVPVTGPGWTITNCFESPIDFSIGKTYKLFIRLKGAAAAGAAGPAVSAGIHVGTGPRTCARSIKCEELDGTFKTYEIGSWTPATGSGQFYIALDSRNAKAVSDVCLDSIWLIEVPAGAAPAKDQ